MSQGKAFNKDKVIQSLEPYFKLGCNLRKACEYAGIPYTTVHNWVNSNEELRIKITAWQNEMSTIARKNWRTALEKGEINSSVNWLSKKEKDEFADRVEQTAKDGEPLFNDENKEQGLAAIRNHRRADTGEGD